MDKAILKVYPSMFWHDNVVVIGNKEGLLKLKEAIDTALTGNTGDVTVEETDGNLYKVISKMHDGDLLDESWLELPEHYAGQDVKITKKEKDFLAKFLSFEQEVSVE